MSEILHQLSLLVSPPFAVFRSEPGAGFYPSTPHHLQCNLLNVSPIAWISWDISCLPPVGGFRKHGRKTSVNFQPSVSSSVEDPAVHVGSWCTRPHPLPAAKATRYGSSSWQSRRGCVIWVQLEPAHHLQRKFPLPRPTSWQEPHTSPHPFSACLTYPHAERRSWQPLMVSYHSSSGFSASWKPWPIYNVPISWQMGALKTSTKLHRKAHRKCKSIGKKNNCKINPIQPHLPGKIGHEQQGFRCPAHQLLLPPKKMQ